MSPLFAPLLFLFYRRRLVQNNIARAFPGMDAGSRRRVHWRFALYFVNTVFEYLKGASMPAGELRRRMTLQNPDVLRAYVERGETMVLFLPHYGNWEWFWLVFSEAFSEEAEVCAVYRTLHVAALDRFVVRMRTRFGGRVIPDRNVGRYLRRKSSRPHIFCLVADQRPARSAAKQWVSMLGCDTALQPGAGKLPVLLQCPVFFVDIQPEARGDYSTHFSRLSTPPYSRGEEGHLLQSFARAVEQQVRARPECFLWSMNRWRYKAPKLRS